MDTIGSSTKLMWFFVCIYSYPILLLIFSVAIWSYNRFKRLAFISYITGTILTVFILLIDINNLVAKLYLSLLALVFVKKAKKLIYFLKLSTKNIDFKAYLRVLNY